MKAALVIALLTLAGCERIDPPLTNEEIVKQVDYCHAHHLKPVMYYAMLGDSQIHAVQCDLDSKESTP